MVDKMPPFPTADSKIKSPSLALRLSQNIAARRRALKLTQAQFAEHIGVDTETVSRFERGKHLPSLATLELLAKILHCTVADLLAEERPQSSDNAIVISARLSGLAEEDRAFVMALLLQCCDYLAKK
jgi:transcriptional regulator with XRE-family HTH domain